MLSSVPDQESVQVSSESGNISPSARVHTASDMDGSSCARHAAFMTHDL